MGSVADLWDGTFSEDAVVADAVEKQAEDILGKPVEEMTEDEVTEKLAEIEEEETFSKIAEIDYARGCVMADGFMERLAEAGIDLGGLHQKLAEIAYVVNPDEDQPE